MASVVGKTIFSDGKGKLFFGYYKTDDSVEFVDYKTWKKLNFKDVSKGDTNKERVIKAIVKNQKQFNKKVDFNMWAKKQKRSFEDTMDWFIQNGWISNITKRGIKEGVEDVLSVNEISIPQLAKKDAEHLDRHLGGKSDREVRAFVDRVYKFYPKDVRKYMSDAFIDYQKNNRTLKYLTTVLRVMHQDIRESVNEVMKPSQVRSAISRVKKGLMRKWKQKGGYENFGQKELSQMKDKFDYNPYGSSDERQIAKMLDAFDNWAMNYDGSMREDRNSNMFYVLYQKKGVFGKPAAAGYKDRKDAEKFAKSLGNNHNTMILDKQSMKNVKGVDVKEGKKRFKRQDGIGKSKYTISYHDGKKKHKDGSDFFDIKIFKNKKDLSDFVRTLVKQGYKLTNEDKSEVEKIVKQVGKNEIKFYDALSKVEKRLGSKYPKFLDTALRQLKQNPSSLKTNADKEEKLFNLVK